VSAVVAAPAPQVRAMRAEDLPAVMAVERLAYEFPWTPGIFRDCLQFRYVCRVLDSPQGILGYGVMSVGVGECHILNICVHPAWQRRGFGRYLVEHLLAVARGRQARMALLEVRRSNDAAYRLYSSMGFNEIGLRRGYYPARTGREDARVLAREL
jgi:ribosomal-protein-alanine N-acetyltransferase